MLYEELSGTVIGAAMAVQTHHPPSFLNLCNPCNPWRFFLSPIVALKAAASY
jgi:hypothetical protein